METAKHEVSVKFESLMIAEMVYKHLSKTIWFVLLIRIFQIYMEALKEIFSKPLCTNILLMDVLFKFVYMVPYLNQ